VIASSLSQKVRLLELRARKAIADVRPGNYQSAFRGQGMEFQEIREYSPGDDTRNIDWNVTARLGRPYIKRFSEEREQTVILMVDGSWSTFFGSGSLQKRDAEAEICALLAFAAAHSQDRVGLILFSGDVETYIPPAKGVPHVLRLIREILAFQPRKKGTNIARALEFFGKVQRRSSFAFLISDFQDRNFESHLRVCAQHHDVVAVSVFDAREHQLPDCGLIEFEDPETGKSCLLDTSDPEVRNGYEDSVRQRSHQLKELFQSAGVDHLRITAGIDYFPALTRFLRVHALKK